MARDTLHGVVAVILWVVFGVYWYVVARQPMNPDTKLALATLFGLLFLAILYIIFWVYHNIRLAKRLPRRVGRRRQRPLPVMDYLGRWLVITNPEALRNADHIVVTVRRTEVEGAAVEEKLFRPVRRSP